MFILQIVVVLLVAIGAVFMLVLSVQRSSAHEAANRSLAVAEGFAHAPGVVRAMESPNPTARLQQGAKAAEQGSGVDFVTVVNREGIRLTATTPGLVGKPTTQDMAPLQAGKTTHEKAAGVIGPQYRSFVPVKDSSGFVIGAVGAGITMQSVSSSVNNQLPAVIGGAAGAVAITTGGAALISRRLIRQTHGLGPTEITRMYEHHDAVLHAAKEGILIVDGEGRLLLANDEAQRLLNLPRDPVGRPSGELDLAPPLVDLLVSGREATDEVHLAESRVLAVNQRPLGKDGGPSGSVVTLRDSTELQALSGRVEAVSGRLKLLYNASVRVGTTLGVGRTAEELTEVAVPHFADYASVDLAETVLGGGEPKGTERQLRRTAIAGVAQGHPLLPTGALIPLSGSAPERRALTGGRAVLRTDLRDAPEWRAQGAEHADRLVDYGIHSLISAPLSARGTVLGSANFWRSGESPPFDEDDLALAEELAARAAVCVDNARRYTREHGMAETLQRSLLPSSMPQQSALDVAYRYLPAQKSVGGDWFDVIPMPGTRVALVVGDVVGQGVHAAVTMGRLRTAVRAFSTLDLLPDELLGHLDELAGLIGREAAVESDEAIVGATCVYAIYDPVNGHCTMARAGHLPPALIRPDGTVEFVEVPAGPPLGVGGLQFETAEIVVPEGSNLVFYTDGLVEDRTMDIDESLDALRATLSHAEGNPEQICRMVLSGLLPRGGGDDTALLVARTRMIPAERVSRWEVPSDPEAVGALRTAVARKLAEWDLEETSFSTELIVSELVTNAIRYATGPIALRLLLDRQLICEVSDGSSTAPHLGYATATDEGGRGLFLVAQVADRWGTRYTPEGKIIWSEQSLPSGYRGMGMGRGRDRG
jgi:PAS domain-containing protein/anti-sigma regulatory factor (Ser/Thr protein kinase)